MRNRGNEILNITVDVGNGNFDNLIVHEFDDPGTLSREFVSKYNLSQKIESALTRNIQELIKELAKDQTVNNTFFSKSDTLSTNYGEKLYLKGLRHKEQIEINKQLLKLQIEKKNTQEASFKPCINRNSIKLAKNAQTRSSTDFRAPNPPTDSSEYTFAPKINENSLKIAKNSNNRIQELYEEAKQRRKKIDEVARHARLTEFPFRPNIKVKGKPTNSQELIERLANPKNSHYESMEQLKKQSEVTKDPETGQEYFKPVISKFSQSMQNRENIWEFLYQVPKKQPDHVNNYPYSPVNLESKLRSDKLLLKLKVKRYSEVFEQLSPDSNGQIFFENINMDSIDHQLLKIIMPLLVELEELNQPLNFEEFIDSMENLLKTLNNIEKNILLGKSKKRLEENPSVKKSISAADITKVYDRHLEKKNSVAAKLEIEREKKKLLELEGCTFHPKTIKFPVNIFK
jgi:hypothetical protein